MGAIVHVGDSIGATPPIDDSSVSDKKLWSSQKIQNELANKANAIQSKNVVGGATVTFTGLPANKPYLVVIGRTDSTAFSAVYAHFPTWGSNIALIMGTSSYYTVSHSDNTLSVSNTTNSSVDAMVLS